MLDLANPVVACLSVFAAGAAASLNPCVLVVYPIIISYVGGYSEGKISRAFWDSLFFIIGLSITYTILGMLAALTGSLLGNIGWYWNYIIGAAAIFFGLNLLGAFHFNSPTIKVAGIKSRGIFGALLLGLLFGLTASACSTPILGVVLAYVASTRNILYGATLLFAYALGSSVLILFVGVSSGFMQAGLKVKQLAKASELVPKISGVIFVMVGIWIIMFS